MNRYALILIALLFVGCNSEGGSSSPTSSSTSPVIASLRISPSSVTTGYGGGATSIDVWTSPEIVDT